MSWKNHVVYRYPWQVQCQAPKAVALVINDDGLTMVGVIGCQWCAINDGRGGGDHDGTLAAASAHSSVKWKEPPAMPPDRLRMASMLPPAVVVASDGKFGKHGRQRSLDRTAIDTV